MGRCAIPTSSWSRWRPITLAHGLRAGAYSHPHRDPFDRMLAAQAELERLVLLSADPELTTFPCQTLW
ncbi:hypothetical protein SynRS9909_02080 [Synechococcus sp. RS9909]|uniref:type II toxin-antitoxin system VapC family toxin n=1 Tax=unclassified Synechococcus TaxID=2626047 RepID=UPI000068F61A|nr:MULTISPECIES: hypothetical protein [unclassified Synechococcus]EAQ69666.1 hypothetical protein RS9917_09531 [Synechococcus sp. RS9917]QNI80063.1 hypothetical protein SynRS9909_02080 [Synechococcus sp. RS9909]